MQIQNFCCALWSVNHSCSSMQRSEDVIAFHLLKAREGCFRRPCTVLHDVGISRWVNDGGCAAKIV